MSKPASTIICVPFELLRVAQGHPTRFVTVDGDEIEIRLASPEELLDIHVTACRSVGLAPTMTIEQARDLAGPITP